MLSYSPSPSETSPTPPVAPFPRTTQRAAMDQSSPRERGRRKSLPNGRRIQVAEIRVALEAHDVAHDAAAFVVGDRYLAELGHFDVQSAVVEAETFPFDRRGHLSRVRPSPFEKRPHRVARHGRKPADRCQLFHAI